MDQKQLVKQMIDFNKTSMENSFSTMALLQEQTEKLGKSALEQTSWLPVQGKKVIDDFTDAFKKGRDDFRKGVDEAFTKVEDYFKTV